LRDALDAITCPRPPLAGLDLPMVAVMGVVNVTPDSFSDGGEFAQTQDALAQGRALLEAGADILDIGGESTRPGADATPIEEERARVVPVIEGLVGHGVPISIDTRKAEIMRHAAQAGARLVNDVTALRYDPQALGAARDLGLPVVLMHSVGDPKTMQIDPTYDDVVLDVYDALAERIEACVAAGLAPSQLVVDPGIGFGKTFEHNHTLLHDLAIFHGLRVRVMLGVSRKAFIGALTSEKTARNRVVGSVAAALIGVMQGVQILRVHDVRETVQAVRTWLGILQPDRSA
jgi:dihydropteroate synthase